MNEMQQIIRNKLEACYEQKLSDVDSEELEAVVESLMDEFEIELHGKEKTEFIYAVLRG